MSHDPFENQLREIAEPGDEWQRVRRGDADSAHADVNLEVDRNAPARLLRLPRERFGEGERYRSRTAESSHLGGSIGGDLTEQQHGA
jgi:hypothetical protein